MLVRALLAMVAVAAALPAQDAVQASEPEHKTFVVENGTRIPLSMVNSVSTKTSGEGDRVYLETSFPIAVKGKIVIPAGSYVLGTVMASKRPVSAAHRAACGSVWPLAGRQYSQATTD